LVLRAFTAPTYHRDEKSMLPRSEETGHSSTVQQFAIKQSTRCGTLLPFAIAAIAGAENYRTCVEVYAAKQ